MYGGRDNPHDAFVDLKGALEIVVRSRKPKAVELAKWLTRKGVEKIVEEKQREIEEKDSALALLNDDLTEREDRIQQLEHYNVGLHGEIRAKDNEIQRRQEEVLDLIHNRHVPRRYPIDSVS